MMRYRQRKEKGEKRPACQVCGKEMDPRSIQRHLEAIHGTELTRNVCVDESRDIFMVRKSSNGGIGYPVHVQMSVAGPLGPSNHFARRIGAGYT